METAKRFQISLNKLNSKIINKILIYIMILIGAFYLGFKSFLIFHTAIEIACIIIASTMAVISINTHDMRNDNRIIFLGIAYGFIALFDLIHTFAYKGMGFFLDDSANLPTQLWIIARYMESISLLIITVFSNRYFKLRRIIPIYLTVSITLLLSIFTWNAFPQCYSEELGLTKFKIISEYIICGILLIGMLYVIKSNQDKSKKTTALVFLSLLTTLTSEICFTWYIDVYDKIMIIGHIFKLISFYFVYISLVETSLRNPYYALDDMNRILNIRNKELENLIESLNHECEIREKIELEDEMKNIFFSTVSHEFKTPLNIILGSIQMLERVYSRDVQIYNFDTHKKYMKMMKQNCNRLLKLVNNIVDITRIDSGFMQINLKNEDIVSVIEDITLSVAEYAKNLGVSLVFDTDIEEKIIACDADKIERIILNLLSNALKFTETGGSVNVDIKGKKESIILSVKDTGIGVPENMLEIIFDRFRQVDTSLRRKKEGSGIGLSIVKSMVELHGGRINVISELGKGSEFIIELPAIQIDEATSYNEVSVTREVNVERINIEFSDIYM